MASVPINLRRGLHVDAMSAARLDLTSFLKGWGRSGGRGKGWGKDQMSQSKTLFNCKFLQGFGSPNNIRQIKRGEASEIF